MEEKLLVGKDSRQYKEIAVYDNPEKLKLLLNKLTWKLLQTIGDREMYPMEIAKRLNIHEQKVYYHMRKLLEAQAIRKVREEEMKGAIAKFYRVNFPAFGVELPFGKETRKHSLPVFANRKLKEFMNPILMNNVFEGKIVVGSPDPHGPFKTSARDGHYAAYLTFFLGQFSELPAEFTIKLDVDIKAEKEEENNLILVGGPGTNLLTQEINEHLPIKFNMAPSKQGFLFGGLISQKTGNNYATDTMGLIAKIVNPWNSKKRAIVLAGNKAVGTKACVLGIAKYSKEILRDYEGEDHYAAVVQGFDLDGDGKIDSIEKLE